ncbi:hypothetical protein [Duganella violaceipulchra]|uniref:Chromosome segregation ATPase n=1 Tax=Duganella violaceipulchra TaxID=2849652 RepID=A0AA41HCQ2_9BURK|nr:hypothetical protein [Duganella violaceicalia]MBV6322487.1 hypothetical protein [Duganella violaceicalia]MCP2010694.1 chromosome segregation ATPase [Duganella violaceicalia]
MLTRSARRIPAEFPEDIAAAESDLPSLREIQRLQLLRGLAAATEVAAARRTCALARQCTERLEQSLSQRRNEVQQARRKHACDKLAQPASISALTLWRHNEFAMLGELTRHSDELHRQRDAARQAQEQLDELILRHRRIESRREKYTQLIEELDSAR